MHTVIYHNPRCSKSRQTLALLQEKDILPEVIEYLNTPPTAEELKNVLSLLNLGPRDLIRKKEAEYKEYNLDNPDLSNDDLIAAMIEHPRLIERPIVLCNGKAAIGRPPEDVLKII